MSATAKAVTERGAAPKTSLSDADKEIINRVEEIARKKSENGEKWTISQVALAWSVQKGMVPIVGLSGVERMDEAVAVKGKTLSIGGGEVFGGAIFAEEHCETPVKEILWGMRSHCGATVYTQQAFRAVAKGAYPGKQRENGLCKEYRPCLESSPEMHYPQEEFGA